VGSRTFIASFWETSLLKLADKNSMAKVIFLLVIVEIFHFALLFLNVCHGEVTFQISLQFVVSFYAAIMYSIHILASASISDFNIAKLPKQKSV